MDIEVEQEQEVGVLQQQIEAPMGVVRMKYRDLKQFHGQYHFG